MNNMNVYDTYPIKTDAFLDETYYVGNDYNKKLKKWDLRFLSLAQHISMWSLDPSTKVGACIVDNKNRVVSLGFNGFPRGISDKSEDYNNRDVKLLKVIHGEMNAILFADRKLDNCTLYTYPFLPCARCAVHVIQSGIIRVVAPFLFGDTKQRWEKDVNISKELFMESKVLVTEYHHEDLQIFNINNKAV